nr:MAG TPA: hypothetical protein [Caudoviricetes sp.]
MVSWVLLENIAYQSGRTWHPSPAKQQNSNKFLRYMSSCCRMFTD